jgi:hypothetical protein
MPLAQAAPQSIVNAPLPWHFRPSRRVDPARGTGSGDLPRSMIGGRSTRAQARLVETGHQTAEGRMPFFSTLQAQTPLRPPGGSPECGEPASLGASKRGSGEPPQLRSRGRRFGSDLLWRARRFHPARSMGRPTGQAEPTSTRSCRVGSFDDLPSRCRHGCAPLDRRRASPSLCLVSRHETS